MISIEQKQELKEAFNEFDRDGSGFINTKVKRLYKVFYFQRLHTNEKMRISCAYSVVTYRIDVGLRLLISGRFSIG